MEFTGFAALTSNFQENLENLDHDRGSSSLSIDQDSGKTRMVSRKRRNFSRRSSSREEEEQQLSESKKARMNSEEKHPSLPLSASVSSEFHSSSTCSSSCTTFVHADAASFRDLVQRLTGARDDSIKMPVTKAAGQGRPVLSSKRTSPSHSPSPASRLQDKSPPAMAIKSLPTRRNLFLKNTMVLDLVSPKSPLSLIAMNSSPNSSASSSSSSSHQQRRLDHGGGSLFLQLESPRHSSSIHHHHHHQSSSPELLPLFPMH